MKSRSVCYSGCDYCGISRVVVLRVSSTGTCQTLEKGLELLAKWSNGVE